ncbi:beta-amylase 8 isoform X2 [Andrographis paniculata]|uniref:beta-amylase 8 isoform X2 n=1 Tax=Andrographis paniculata TaxID=175694 RepID=UPI0021E7A6A1|nr:beta-amylase 8 isoform X2 [Andrographis paniculata]
MNTNADSINQCFAAVSGDLDSQQSPPPPLSAQFQLQRRPRGFATTNSSSNNAAAALTSGSMRSRKEREKEKERTKLRERHRRAITSRMLAGLRQYGNFPLPARADMNDVIAALAREAGWTVESDGTTYKQSSTPPRQPQPQPPRTAHLSSIQQNNCNVSNMVVRSVESPLYSSSLKNCSLRSSADCQPSALRLDEDLSPASLDSVAADRNGKLEKYSSVNALNSPECLKSVQLRHDGGLSSYVPVYARLAVGLMNNYSQLMDLDGIKEELQHLKSLHVDGVVVDCWWGMIEACTPKKYEWTGYRELFDIIQEFGMKLQVVMAFHEYRGHDSNGTFISLPQWVLEIGKSNQDIFFTDHEGGRNIECLSWGIDKERVLRGRTGIEVIISFADPAVRRVQQFYISFYKIYVPKFQIGWAGDILVLCYDKYLMRNLEKAAKLCGHPIWARGPDNAGYYNAKPSETGFFSEHGDYESYYGRFFLHWYAQVLIDHADNVLSLASLALEETQIVVQIPAVYWWYKTTSHAAELTAGYYNPCNQDGYSWLFQVLKKHAVTIKFDFSGYQPVHQDADEALSDPDALNWQVLNSAWDQGLSVAGQNVYSCSCDSEGFVKLVETARPKNHPDGKHFAFFVLQQPAFIERSIGFSEMDGFIKSMHGKEM